ncbi:hypothetical protein [Marinoscillum sp. MHG1-6]|uniref:hypothetical protein n=1 Tax=Marinoscillum sp. MHG1-6 TaxID=2959627 RepID=UPI0021579BFA|nr:hypothetical protein [Marinoscillum sp. MHG1-6]
MNLWLRICVITYCLLGTFWAEAQCAMCRTQVVNNVSQGDTSLAAGLNTGILYLFFTPYVAIAVVAYFWYKNAKVNEPKRTYSRTS